GKMDEADFTLIRNYMPNLVSVDLFIVSKDGGKVDAITASTITSRAFLNAVNAAYAAYAGQETADGTTGATQKNVEQPADSAAPEAVDTL
ncbi:FMN-binding protein, partial [Escherichia coli]|nr:FMN-binding protein [Escherichia coli]